MFKITFSNIEFIQKFFYHFRNIETITDRYSPPEYFILSFEIKSFL